ncbi:hypothetical protein LPJ78_001200 [Coemansia sp. RSA 989]|nr:D-glycerate 3-kinase [Coemansia mojavensis]KAJ1743840.1 hypothetical protein LPJ68_000647 [Coemansia sp. RSA 1086]KAJ1746931.1 hypothetical protein LPJ79_005594 [Coemansia sp. RSA 1821]KAJ1867254.1 hypothetical protein LPJ78_001200 [Coemansia sp. RSA 989]KAJ1876012.1 hypothetical protein LPJ55_000192 [Coemansia sp. RSA 990]KAJ2626197.1 hypothetical protein H4R22_004905 [Coemansia sp. RSA 1290]KAJ2652554.1 hypothetical protein IWW40_001040 [Coemansia sp. RSA 1250]KAJ2674085.1 hypothetical 
MKTITSLNKVQQEKQIQAALRKSTRCIAQFILQSYKSKTSLNPNHRSALVVGINGPQGSGKTTLVNELTYYLNQMKLRTVGFSLDDIYLTNQEQRHLAQTHSNPLLRYRGQPGTHDVDLGRSTLCGLRDGRPTKIPGYDKSRYGGYGDRMPKHQWKQVSEAPDIVLFEGWCLGFRSLDSNEFACYLEQVHGDSPLYKYSRKFDDDSLAQINRNLPEYEQKLYPLIDAWVSLRVDDLDVIYRWRKQQEDDLAAQGKDCMSDKQLEDFVSRFMPLYEMAMPKLDEGFVSSGTQSKALRLHLDMDRNMIACDHPKTSPAKL